MSKSLIIFKDITTALTVYKQPLCILQHFKDNLLTVLDKYTHIKKEQTSNFSIRPWDFDNEGNPYYLDENDTQKTGKLK